ncbi:MAG: hypothetical protein HY093_02545 [Candidatus Liptonbacteria bacterium]|nr:hypothetical protein [Candidatus Liptonbacteria bacterium]
MSKIMQILIHSLPLVLGIILSYFFWRHNTDLFLIYLVLSLVVIFLGKDRKTETWIFIYGLIAGFIVETIGTEVSGYQKFTQPDLLGIPYWLVVSWGYGFVLMKRIGFIIKNNSPW